jgi:hypothetical protein
MEREQRPHECCNQLENMRPGPGPRGFSGKPMADERVEHCIVCHCRHYEFTVDPLKIGLKVSDI